MNSENSDGLEEQVRALTARVRRLERAIREHGIEVAEEAPGVRGAAGTASAVPGLPDSSGLPAAPEAARAARVPLQIVASPGSARPDRGSAPDTVSLERRIGSQWFNRLGILALLIGVAWFLKLAFDNHWIGPLGRVLAGLAGGGALIAWSERFRRRGFAAFSYSLKAVGSGTLYLSLWAAFSLYGVLPAGVAFAAMILVTGFNGFLSWVEDAELLALYAIGGALGTPLLVSTGGNHETALFTYLLILDVAVLVLAALRPWSRLLFTAFVGTVLFVTGWWFSFYSQDQAGRTAFFLLCFFLLFAFAPRMVRAGVAGDGTGSPWDGLALVAMPLLNAALGFLAFYLVVDERTFAWGGAWMAVGFAGFYLLLNRLPARGVLHAGSPVLTALHLSLAVAFLTVAIPLGTRGRWVTVGWLVEGGALTWLAARLRSSRLRASLHSALLHVLGLVCLGLGLFALVAINPEAGLTPFLNQRFATYAVGVVVFAVVARTAARAADEPEAGMLVRWGALAGASVLIVNTLILLALGWEIHSFWRQRNGQGEGPLAHDYRIYAQFSYSALFMVYGAALLAVGFWRRSAFLRWQALVLLAISIGKVFLFDVGTLSRGFGILSFLGLGALLLGVSFIYQRDWLNLRDEGNHTR